MFGLGGGASDQELEKLRSACKAHLSAYAGCKAANSGDSTPCANIETSVLACLAAKKCQDQRKAFDKCNNASLAASTSEGRLRIYDTASKCQKEIADMRSCLNKQSIWPKLESKA